MRRKKSLAVMMTVIMCCTVLFPAGSIRTQAASTKQEVQSTLTISKEQEVQSTPSAFQSKDAKNIDVTTVFTVLYMNLEKYAYGHYRKHTAKQRESDNICLR